MTPDTAFAILEPTPAEEPKAHRDSWGEVIIYVDGWAFGIDARGKTVCMGKEPNIRAAVAAPDLRDNLSPEVKAIVQLETQLIKQRLEELKDGRPTDSDLRHRASKIRRRSDKRARPLRVARGRRFNNRQSKKR